LIFAKEEIGIDSPSVEQAQGSWQKPLNLGIMEADVRASLVELLKLRCSATGE